MENAKLEAQEEPRTLFFNDRKEAEQSLVQGPL
jgi:hypothetical protein